MAVSWLPLYHDMGLIGFVLAPICHRMPHVFIPTLSFVKTADAVDGDDLPGTGARSPSRPNFAYALRRPSAPSRSRLARWDLSQHARRRLRRRADQCRARCARSSSVRARRLQPEAMLPCYGMAEATLAISFVALRSTGADRPHRPRRAATGTARQGRWRNGGPRWRWWTAGAPSPGTRSARQDEDGRILPRAQRRRAVLPRPERERRLLGKSASRPRAAFRDGWLRTGDLGYVRDGDVYISGRIKDILIVNGRNYYPQGIEWVADEIPGVRKGSSVVFTRPGQGPKRWCVGGGDRGRPTTRRRR